MKITTVLAIVLLCCLAAPSFSEEPVRQRKDSPTAADEKKNKDVGLEEARAMAKQNLDSIRELFAKAEEAWKARDHRSAASFYSSVAGANVVGSEEMARTSRERLIEAEGLAKARMAEGRDAELRHDYATAAACYSDVERNFPSTAAFKDAVSRIASLKAIPDAAASIELESASVLFKDGKIKEAVSIYSEIASNPRYNSLLSSFKARRRLVEIKESTEAQKTIREQADADMARQAPILLGAAKNYIANNMPMAAREKLNEVLLKWPSTEFSKEAERLLLGIRSR